MTPSDPSFVRRLTAALEGRTPRALDEPGARRAAVAVVFADEPDPSLLLVKRREREGDPWSGHVAFPGGHAEPGESAVTAAIRETLEETGLALERVARRLGQLDDVYPRSVYLPKIVVTPVVFTVPGRLDAKPSNEIERALWVPVRDLFDAANRKPYVLDRPLGRREFESIHVAGLVVWGLTGRILQQIANLYQ